MRIKYNGVTTKRLDQRFNDRVWFEGKDERVRKSKKNAITRRNKKIVDFKNELKRTFALIIGLALVTGFIYLRTKGL